MAITIGVKRQTQILEDNNLLPIPTLTDTLVQRKSNIWHKNTDTNFWHKILAKLCWEAKCVTTYSYIDYSTPSKSQIWDRDPSIKPQAQAILINYITYTEQQTLSPHVWTHNSYELLMSCWEILNCSTNYAT